MRKQFSWALIPFLLFTSACSGGGEAVVTTTTTTAVPITTTTVDMETLKENLRNNFKSELFQNLEWWQDDKPSRFFATTDDIQQVLRKYGISGFVQSTTVPWAYNATPQRKLCEDISLDDAIAKLEPSNIVGRFFHWDVLKADFSNSAVLATGGMHVFEIASSEKLGGLAGNLVDSFNAGGGECQVRPDFYQVDALAEEWDPKWSALPFQQWWNDQKLVDSGTATLRKGRVNFETMLMDQAAEIGFQFMQFGIDYNWIRDFFVFTYPELGLLVLIEVNVYENSKTDKSPSIVEFTDEYVDAVAELQSLLFKNLYNYLKDNNLDY